MILRRAMTVLVLSSVLMLAAPGVVDAEELQDDYFTVYSEVGQEILHTGRILHPGDVFIDEGNRKYEVEQVKDRCAYARYVGDAELDAPSGSSPESEMDAGFPLWPVFEAESEEEQPVVGIYHTHSSESFIPTSGTPSRLGEGDVLKVGEAMTAALREQGFTVKHDTTSHDPHDAGAYTRSRRTAASLLQHQPDVLFDIHRDTGPAETYLIEIDGSEVARALLVVGRANPYMNANHEFAKSLKARADEKYPGLVKGILQASGDYNQDLGPRTLLLEIGSVETTLEQAEESSEKMAGVLGTKMIPDASGEWAAGRSAILMLVVVFVAGGVFLLISTGSWDEARARLGQYLPWIKSDRAK